MSKITSEDRRDNYLTLETKWKIYTDEERANIPQPNFYQFSYIKEGRSRPRKQQILIKCHVCSKERQFPITILNRKGGTLGPIFFCSHSHTMLYRNSLPKVRFKTTDTKPELKVKVFLDLHRINYTHPAIIESVSVDFFIPSKSAIIEVDGCYWHACKEHCPGGRSQDLVLGEKKRITDDLREVNLRAFGYTVIRIWEHDVNSDEFRNLLRELVKI